MRKRRQTGLLGCIHQSFTLALRSATVVDGVASICITPRPSTRKVVCMLDMLRYDDGRLIMYSSAGPDAIQGIDYTLPSYCQERWRTRQAARMIMTRPLPSRQDEVARTATSVSTLITCHSASGTEVRQTRNAQKLLALPPSLSNQQSIAHSLYCSADTSQKYAKENTVLGAESKVSSSIWELEHRRRWQRASSRASRDQIRHWHQRGL